MEKTLLVLGAGASKDFCRIFPTGLELIKEINYHFLTEKKIPEVPESDGIYLSALMNHISRTFGNDIELFRDIKNKLWAIQLGYEWRDLRNIVENAISIDNFIATQINEKKLNHKAADVIKYSIYYLIKGTEQALAEGKYDLSENWINVLAHKVCENNIDSIINNLSVITFNYDRTFEKYFCKYLAKYIKLNSDQINQLQNKVLHVYDSLGDLNEIPFELENNKVDILKNKYSRIKLIDDRSKINISLSNVDDYKKVHFIGFGYDRTNLELLNLEQFTRATFSGTAYNFKDSQINELKSKYNINTINVSCNKYIENIEL